MGCGESKHEVATGNTITKKKSNAGEQSKKSKDVATALQTETQTNETDSSLVQQEEGDHQNVNNEVGGDHPAADTKDIAENSALKEGDLKEKQSGLVAEEQEPKARLISKDSPYFSSRKEGEAVDGTVSEQKSEKSDDYSPRLEAAKDGLFNDNEKLDNAVEATSLVDQTTGETKNEGASVEKENSTKETEVSTPTTSVEKNENAEKEQSVAPPTNDLKTV